MSKRKRTGEADAPPSEDNTIVFAEMDDDEITSTVANDGSVADGPVSHVPPLFGLDLTLTPESRTIVELMDQRIAEQHGICHLRDVPANATWNKKNTLTTVGGRAIVIVVFGNLSAIDLHIKQGQATRLTVAIELLRQEDKDKLQMIYTVARLGKIVATDELTALRVSPDPRSRILNVYDRTAFGPWRHHVRMLSVNELLGGDVVWLDMRCVRVVDGSGVRVDFKLKSIQLIAAIPRGVDIMH